MGTEFAISGSSLAVLVGALVLAGALVGIMSGLLGIGGGGILVPVLYETFTALGVDPAIRMHMALATSLAVIVPTSLRSFSAHKAKGAVDVALVKRMGPWVVLGVVLGIVTASYVSSTALKWFWVVFGTVMAAKLWFGRDSWRLGSQIPKSRAVEVYAFFVGYVSVLISIGGAAFIVAFMTLYGRSVLQAVATSSGFGPLISIPGAIGFAWAGWGVEGTLPFSLGYVSVLGAALIIPMSVLMAPIGVRLAHGIPKRRLEQAFALFLCVIVARFASILMSGS
ncbi:MAG: sulfite exporter TauE/SafE family protein [Hyphomicrobiaceae bacterium]|nr:sulfite exporter TauE/SafE family protein [Hyphomicrobiaceae bacterium]MCC0010308.1 sulfite exporter TauE/SafE family protein [Hyphomicrobiaceae bacterium]